MKRYKIIFWITTSIIFITQGIVELLFGHSDMSVAGITHLGYPVYFISIIVVAKVLGAFALIIPQVPKTLKEWAYAGFTFDFIFAFISIMVVDGFSGGAIFPLIALAILFGSYYSYKKIA